MHLPSPATPSSRDSARLATAPGRPGTGSRRPSPWVHFSRRARGRGLPRSSGPSGDSRPRRAARARGPRDYLTLRGRLGAAAARGHKQAVAEPERSLNRQRGRRPGCPGPSPLAIVAQRVIDGLSADPCGGLRAANRPRRPGPAQGTHR